MIHTLKVICSLATVSLLSFSVQAGEKCFREGVVKGPYEKVEVKGAYISVPIHNDISNDIINKKVLLQKTLVTKTKVCEKVLTSKKRKVCSSSHCETKNIQVAKLEFKEYIDKEKLRPMRRNIEIDYQGLDLLKGEATGALTFLIDFKPQYGELTAKATSEPNRHSLRYNVEQQGRTLLITADLNRKRLKPANALSIRVEEKNSRQITLVITDNIKLQNRGLKLGRSTLNLTFFRKKLLKDKSISSHKINLNRGGKTKVTLKRPRTRKGKNSNRIRYTLNRGQSRYYSDGRSHSKKKNL